MFLYVIHRVLQKVTFITVQDFQLTAESNHSVSSESNEIKDTMDTIVGSFNNDSSNFSERSKEDKQL